MQKQYIIMEKEYIIIKNNIIGSLILDSYKYLGIIFILGINHFKLDDSFFGGIILTAMLIIVLLAKIKKNHTIIKGKKWTIRSILESR
ncbi:hypothetical protein J4438_03865 [Candidatus Woesearchaeota archaeon]|nr:hypothetical protein [Candidatus Woesearchaeota archaeon]